MNETGPSGRSIASRFIGLVPCARKMLDAANNIAEPAMKVRRFILPPKTSDGSVVDQIAPRKIGKWPLWVKLDPTGLSTRRPLSPC
jgi:hypothetical protein